jgi:membrane protein
MTKLERIILNLRPIQFVIRKSRKNTFPGFKGMPVHDVSVIFIEEIKKDRLIDRAASVSFFFLLAIPPSFIFLFTLLPYVPLKGLENTIYSLLHDITPNKNSYVLIKNMVYDFLHTRRNGLLSFAFLLGFVTSSSGVLGIMRSFDKRYPGFKKRNFFQRRWIALKITTLLVILVILCITLILAQRTVFHYVFSLIGAQNTTIRFIVELARWVIIVLLFFVIFSFIYTYGPNIEKRWKFITAGSAMATSLTIITTLGFSYYVNHFSSYNRIYGSIGTILVLMIWIYINSLVLLIGFELNASIDILKKQQLSHNDSLVK